MPIPPFIQMASSTRDTDSLLTPIEDGSMASDVEVCIQRDSDDTDYQQTFQKNLYDPPYFAPLNADDEYDVYDIELVLGSGGKQAGSYIHVRYRGALDSSSGRPTYKAEKKPKNHFLGKKNLHLSIYRNDSWDSTLCAPVANKGNSYVPIFQCLDQNPRCISVTSTKYMVLHNTTRGGQMTLSPNCGSYDPQRSRAVQPRDGLTYHYVPMNTTDFDRSPPTSGANISKDIPAALTKPYTGGGHLVFDADSQGRQDLLSTLYCTGYEMRHKIRRGDIALAEFRLTRPALDASKNAQPLWRRFFRERHASLHISRRGVEAAFIGDHINMFVPNPEDSKRYTLTKGQGHEIIVSLYAMSLLAIEHDGLESKKWMWLLQRDMLRQGGGITTGAKDNTQELSEKPPQLSARSREEVLPAFEPVSVVDAASANGGVVHSLKKPNASFDQWEVMTYTSDLGEPSAATENVDVDAVGFNAGDDPVHKRHFHRQHMHVRRSNSLKFSHTASFSEDQIYGRVPTPGTLNCEGSEDAQSGHRLAVNADATKNSVDEALDSPDPIDPGIQRVESAPVAMSGWPITVQPYTYASHS